MGGVRANPFSRERDDGSLRRIITIDRIIDIINDNGQQFLREAFKNYLADFPPKFLCFAMNGNINMAAVNYGWPRTWESIVETGTGQ